jgi:two-component system cell cycle sensor histidine kinase/response regulator CckA
VEQDSQKTILIVDDEPSILTLVTSVLANRGYGLLTASTGSQALQQSRNFNGEIQLLLSDFQMPEMSGTDLATAITVDRPKIKVLLMSSFPQGMLVLNEGWHFLDKPFLTSQLRALVSGLVTPDKASRFSREVSSSARGLSREVKVSGS